MRFLIKTFVLITFFSGNFSYVIGQEKLNYELEKVFDRNSGLSSNKVIFSYRDKDELMFIGTQNGVNIYDGYSFHLNNTHPNSLFQLNGNLITSIVTDTVGNIWIASNNGINKINTSNKTNTSYFNEGNKKYPPSKKWKKGDSWIAKTIDGQIWGVSNGILYKIDEEDIIPILSTTYNNVRNLIADASGQLYFFCDNKLVSLSLDGTIIFEKSLVLDEEDTSLFGFRPKLYKNRAGTIILSTKNNTISYLLDSKGAFKKISREDSKFVLALEMTRQYCHEKGKGIPFFSNYFEDVQGIIWLSTNIGLVKIVPKINHFKKIPALTNISCRGLYEHEDGLIYGGTYSPFDLFSYNPVTEELKWIEGIKNVYDISQLQGDTLLIVCDGGPIYLFDAKKQIILDSKSTNDGNYSIYNTYLDQSDTLWYAQYESLLLANKDTPLDFVKLNTKTEDPINQVSYFMQVEQIGKNTFWIATSIGLFKYEKRKGTLAVYHKNGAKEKSILNDFIRQFVIDKKGNLWIGTAGGLNYLDSELGIITKAFTTEDGLADDFIYSLILENDSTLWLGTNYGLSKFDTKKERFVNFYEKEGIANAEFNTNSYLKTKNGHLIFGGLSGVTIVNPFSLPEKKNNFIPFISQYLKYDGKEGKVNTNFFNNGSNEPINIQANEKYIEIHFSNKDFLNPQITNFAYYLDGFEKDWIYLGNRNTIRYTNLDQGNYLLKVKTANSDGLWSDKILEVPIIVKRPYYEQWWFIALIIFLSAIFITALCAIYIYQQNQANKIRHRIATDLHDDVSNSLNNIRIIATDLKNTLPIEVPNDLDRIHRISSAAISYVQDVIWSVDEKLTTIDHLIFVMEDYLDEVIRSKGIPVKISTEGLNGEKVLKILIRRNLLLIFKEAISNAAKHTEITKIDIRLENRSLGFQMFIKNQFDQKKLAEISTGRGIKNMKQRAAYINGVLVIKSTSKQFLVHLNLTRRL